MSELMHVPVLKDDVLRVLEPKVGESVLDVTLGLGGHAAAFLQKTGPTGSFIGLDADADNLAIARERLSDVAERIDLRHVNFGAIGYIDLPRVDIVFADLGLSSPHLDDPERGFSFRFDGPLDLRFDRSGGKTAADIIRSSDEKELAQIFRAYGELYKEAGKLSRMLAGKEIATTAELKDIVEQGFGFRAKQILPQVFQALRMAVNDELGVLERLLRIGPELLKPGGRMGVLSYHSLEDRMVKTIFRELSTPVKDDITGQIAIKAPFEVVLKKPLQASSGEIAGNPRARSVKFRALRRVSV